MATALTAWAGEYDRAVQFDWEPNLDAKSYEVEWFQGPQCSVEAGTTVVEKPLWNKKLPAGKYCFRVRAIGRGDRPGQWTDMQKFDVTPKPPANLIKSPTSNEWSWSEVEYAKKYEVEVADSTGKVLYRENTAKNTAKVPDSVMKYIASKPGEYAISVKTEMDGLLPSVPISSTFEVKAQAIPGKPGSQKIQIISQQKDVRRSLAQEMIQRITLPMDAVNTIPDWRISVGAGPTLYKQTGSNRMQGSSTTPPSMDNSGMTLKFSGQLEYLPKDLLGFYLWYDTQKMGYDSNVSLTYSSFGAGLTFNFNPNRRWGHQFTFGVAPRISSFSFLFPSNTNSSSGGSSEPAWAIDTQMLGFEAKGRYLQELNQNWALETTAKYHFSSSQNQAKSLLKSGISGFQFKAGPLYKFSPSFWVSTQAFYESTSYSAVDEVGKESAINLTDYGVQVSAVIRTGSSDGRTLASVNEMNLTDSSLWRLALELPVSFRNQDYLIVESSTSSTTSPARSNTSLMPIGAAVSLERKLSRTSPYLIGAEVHNLFYSFGGYGLTDRYLGVYGKYEFNIGRRPDLKDHVGLFVGSRTVGSAVDSSCQCTSGNESFSSQVNSFVVGVMNAFEKVFNLKWKASLDAKLGYPLYLGGSSVGTSYVWSVGGRVNYQLDRSWGFVMGYGFEQVRFAVESSPNNLNTISGIGYGQHQIKVGVSLDW